MSDNFDIKLRNHIKFNNDDIKEFCKGQVKKLNLDDYVVETIFKKILFGLASYDKESKSVCLNDTFIEDYKAYKRKFQSKKFLDRILILDADIYNLFIIDTIFHELRHAEQEKEKNENPNSSYSILIKVASLFMLKSGSTYNFYHDRYYHEYDAIINSMLYTLDYIKDFSIDKGALFLLNRSYASHILDAYGINSEYDSHNKYESPIDFFKFFFDEKFWIDDEEKSIINKLESSILDYQADNDVDSLLYGYQISNSLIEILISVRSGQISSINLFKELGTMEERKNHK